MIKVATNWTKGGNFHIQPDQNVKFLQLNCYKNLYHIISIYLYQFLKNNYFSLHPVNNSCIVRKRCCIIVEAVKICVFLQLSTTKEKQLKTASTQNPFRSLVLLFRNMTMSYCSLPFSWEDKHFFSFILDKVLAKNNKRNQLKIKGMKIYSSKQSMTSSGSIKTKIYKLRLALATLIYDI